MYESVAMAMQVYAFGKPRSNPNAKDSQWVRDRAELESKKPGVAGGVCIRSVYRV